MEMSRVEHGELEEWLGKHMLPSDRVVIESTTNAWHVYDLLEPLVGEVLVANPVKVKQIACARVKTDKKDTLILAAIGDITRFETPQTLASYSGLTPGLEQSGVKLRGEGITKEGQRELRWALVEVA